MTLRHPSSDWFGIWPFSMRTTGAALLAGLLMMMMMAAAACDGALAQRVVPSGRAAIRYSFAPIVKQVTPAVVNVYVQHRQRAFNSPFAEDPFFRRFFGRSFGQPTQRIQNSLGSGVIVSPDGIVVTNNHVIKGGGRTTIKVALSDKREFDAKVVLRDKVNDLAILRIIGARGKFPYLAFDDSDRLQVGDLVLAIGNPFGVGQTVTSGIISALARSKVLRHGGGQMFIQTDAAINPGNSGGALVDMAGRLIGINSAIYTRSGGSNGIGFAIPSNLVRLVVDSALSGRKVGRPWLGAKLQSVTRDIAEAVGLRRVAGALVKKVHRGGPAAAAGMKSGDVITAIDGHPIADARSINYRLTTRGIGNTAEVEVIRAGRKRLLQLAIRAVPRLSSADKLELTGDHPLDGASVARLGPALADDLGINIESGVAITAVRRGSYAANLGLRRGDIIVSVGSWDISNLRKLQTALRSRPDYWSITIRRGRRLLSIRVPG